MAANFTQYSEYYDLINSQKDYAAEVDYITRLIGRFKPGAEKLLELGSGTGNHAIHLSAKGFRLTGVEKSGQMAEIARSKSIPNFDVQAGDITDLQLAEQFDCAISLFHVISYMTSDNQVLAVFRGVADSLNEKGIFIFDTWYTPAVYTQQPGNRTREFENALLKITRQSIPTVDAVNNTVTVNFDIQVTDKTGGLSHKISEQHIMRHFSLPEIRLFALATGFEVRLAEEFYTGRTPGTDTWGVCFILQKL